MTRQADFKRRVRARMAKTGESYATARRALLAGTTPDDSPLDWMPEALHISNGSATVSLTSIGYQPTAARRRRDTYHHHAL